MKKAVSPFDRARELFLTGIPKPPGTDRKNFDPRAVSKLEQEVRNLRERIGERPESPFEVLNELPDAAPEHIGKLVFVRSVGGVASRAYIGIQRTDEEADWRKFDDPTLEPGVDVLAFDQFIQDLADLTHTPDSIIYINGTGDPAVSGLTGFSRTIFTSTNGAQYLTTMGLTATAAEINILDGVTGVTAAELSFIGDVTSLVQAQLNNKQPLDTDLTTIAGLTATTNNFMVATSSAWASRTPAQALVQLGVTATAAELNALDGITATVAELNILDGATVSAAELNILDGVIGVTAAEISFIGDLTSLAQVQLNNKQPLDTDLTAIAALVSAADRVPYATGSGTWSLATFTLAGRNLMDDANAAAQLVTLGLTATAAEINILDGVVGVSAAEISFLDGVGSALAGISDVATFTNKTYASPDITGIANFTPDATGEKISLYGAAAYSIGVESNTLVLASGGSTVSLRTGGYAGTVRLLVNTTGAVVTGTLGVSDLAGSGTRVVSVLSTGVLTDGALLNDFDDVSILTPAQGQLLTYDSGTWVNADPQQGIITIDDRSAGYAAKFGSAGASNGQFANIRQIAVSPVDGSIYVADSGNGRVQKFNSAGAHVSNIAASGPTGVAVDNSGNVYVLEGSGGLDLEKYNSAHALQWGVGINTAFGHVCTDGTHVYYTEFGLDFIMKKLASTGAHVAIYGETGSGPGQFIDPLGIATDGTYLYIVDQGNDRIQKMTTSGYAVAQWGLTGSDPGEFQLPYAISYDPNNDLLAVTDQTRDDVQVFTTEGAYVGEFSGPGSADGLLQEPTGVAATTTGNDWWVGDATQERLQRFAITVTSEEATRVGFNTDHFIVGTTDDGETAYVSLKKAKSLTALDDVLLDAVPVSGDLLMFNGSRWINATITERTGSAIAIGSNSSNTGTASCSAGEIALGFGISASAAGVVVSSAYRTDIDTFTFEIRNLVGSAQSATPRVQCLG